MEALMSIVGCISRLELEAVRSNGLTHARLTVRRSDNERALSRVFNVRQGVRLTRLSSATLKSNDCPFVGGMGVWYKQKTEHIVNR